MAIQFTAEQLGTDSVETAKIKDANVTFAKVSGAAISTDISVGENNKLARADAVKTYVDSVAQGLDLKESIKYASTANLGDTCVYANGSSGVGATITAQNNGALSVDSATPSVSDRILVKDQTVAAQNGIYTVTTVGSGGAKFVLTRATDFDTAAKMDKGSFTFCESGTVNFDAGFVMTQDGTITVGDTAITWTQFSGAGQITAGSGLSKSGNTLSVTTGGITSAMIANGAIVDADINASAAIAITKLAASTISGKSLGTNLDALTAGDGISMSSYNGSAAVSNLTVALDGSSLAKGGSGLKVNTGGIANNEVSASAAIDYSKLAALASGSILVGSGANVATGVALSGDATMANNGALTIANDAVSLAKMAGLTAANFILGDASNNPAAVTMSGDATLSNSGALTIAAGAVEHGMLNDDIISGQAELAHADIAAADELMISDAGVIKRVGVDSLRDHYYGQVSGDATIADLGALTIANNAVSLAKMAGLASGKLILGDSNGDPAAVTMGGDATLSNTGALTIANDAVEQAMIADDAVGADQLASNAVVNASVVDGSLKADKLDIDGSTDINADLADGDLFIVDDGANGTNRKSTMVRVPKFVFSKVSGDATINTSNGTLTIANDAVNAAKLASNAVVNDSVDASAGILFSKMEGLASTQIVVGNGSGVAAKVAVTGDVTISNAGVTAIGASKVTLAMSAFRPKFESGTNVAQASPATLALAEEVASGFEDGVLVYKNGQLLRKVAAFSDPTDNTEYRVTSSGGTTTVTFGASPAATDLIAASYIY